MENDNEILKAIGDFFKSSTNLIKKITFSMFNALGYSYKNENIRFVVLAIALAAGALYFGSLMNLGFYAASLLIPIAISARFALKTLVRLPFKLWGMVADAGANLLPVFSNWVMGLRVTSFVKMGLSYVARFAALSPFNYALTVFVGAFSAFKLLSKLNLYLFENKGFKQTVLNWFYTTLEKQELLLEANDLKDLVNNDIKKMQKKNWFKQSLHSIKEGFRLMMVSSPVMLVAGVAVFYVNAAFSAGYGATKVVAGIAYGVASAIADVLKGTLSFYANVLDLTLFLMVKGFKKLKGQKVFEEELTVSEKVKQVFKQSSVIYGLLSAAGAVAGLYFGGISAVLRLLAPVRAFLTPFVVPSAQYLSKHYVASGFKAWLYRMGIAGAYKSAYAGIFTQLGQYQVAKFLGLSFGIFGAVKVTANATIKTKEVAVYGAKSGYEGTKTLLGKAKDKTLSFFGKKPKDELEEDMGYMEEELFADKAPKL